MNVTCLGCGEQATSRQRWWQPNLVKYYVFMHEDKEACRVKAAEPIERGAN